MFAFSFLGRSRATVVPPCDVCSFICWAQTGLYYGPAPSTCTINQSFFVMALLESVCWKLNYTEQMASVVPPQTLGPFRSVRASGWTRWNAPDIWLCSNNTHYSRHTLILRKEGVIFVLMVHEGRGLQARILLSRQNLVVAFKIFPIVTPYFINHSFSLEQLESVECAPLNTSECHPYIHMWSFDSGDNI